MNQFSFRGVRILSTVWIVVACLGFLTIGVQTTFISIALKLPDEKKLEAIQQDQLYEMDITTVDEFDNFMKKQSPLGTFWGTISCLLILFLFVAAIFLRKGEHWARISLIALSVYYIVVSAVSVFYGLLAVSVIVTFILNGFTIYYLTHPTVKTMFQQSITKD